MTPRSAPRDRLRHEANSGHRLPTQKTAHRNEWRLRSLGDEIFLYFDVAIDDLQAAPVKASPVLISMGPHPIQLSKFVC